MLEFIAKKIFGTKSDRLLRTLQPVVAQVNHLEQKYEKLSNTELQAQTAKFREQLDNGESINNLLPDAFAVVREASKRVLDKRPYDVQIIGGAVLHDGKIAEMKTGEGKTLAATLPAYLNALTGKGVHVVTVNDYLARRDSEWMGSIYNFLGLEVGVVYSGLDEKTKRDAYLADITYGQNNEFGFDYLRDNMKFDAEMLFQRAHHYAIVDEVDSILIDEARTPLIISGPAEDSTDKYYRINKIIPSLKIDADFEVELKTKIPHLTEEGVAHVEKLLKVDNLYDPHNIELLHHVNQGLKAHVTFEKDVDYLIKDGKIVIIDEFTGRPMEGRRWSQGLHQAIEAKEGLTIARENQTLASITFQNYFRMYEKLSGMTGTAETEAEEFEKIYGLEVVVIPTNRPLAREDLSDQVFRTTKEKRAAVIDSIADIHETGQPVLVGTISIEQSEDISKLLRKRKIEHNVLNAKHLAREADIVAQAGRLGAVTISTNMAGRGTDIVLGGNPEFLAADEVGGKDLENPDYLEAFERFSKACAEEQKKVLELGGLHILGTERHESRRIDNQLRGRAGRQGDPGSSEFFVSLEDDLMKRFGGEKIQQLMSRLGWEEGVALDGNLMSRSIESAQRKVEGMHFDERKRVTEYDDVMNKQRQVIYDLRRKVLLSEGVRETILEMIDDLLEEYVLTVCDESVKPMNWDLSELSKRISDLTGETVSLSDDIKIEVQEVYDQLRTKTKELYAKNVERQEQKLEELKATYMDKDDGFQVQISERSDSAFDFTFEGLEQNTILENLDRLWNDHLHEMDELRQGIGWRGMGQKNPLLEYQREAFTLFQGMTLQLKDLVIRSLFAFDSEHLENFLAHIEAERTRRRARMKSAEAVHENPDGEEQEPEELIAKDPNEEKAKLEAARKARRKQRKRR